MAARAYGNGRIPGSVESRFYLVVEEAPKFSG